MATTIESLKNKIKVLQAAGLPYDKELSELDALSASAPATATPSPAPATAAVPATQAEPDEGLVIAFEDNVNPDTLSGGDNVPPSSAGIWKSKLMEIGTSFSNDKNWRVFVVETNDARLAIQGHGTLICDLDKVAWKLTKTLDNLGIAYKVDGSKIAYSVRLPLACESEWQEVKLKNGKTELKVQNLYAVGKAPEPVL